MVVVFDKMIEVESLLKVSVGHHLEGSDMLQSSARRGTGSEGHTRLWPCACRHSGR